MRTRIFCVRLDKHVPIPERRTVMRVDTIASLPAVKPQRGLLPQHFQYHRRLIQALRARAPYLLPLAAMEVRAELALRRKLFAKSKPWGSQS
jgi:hypothetical protein